MSPLDIAIATLRGIHVLALISLFGTLLFIQFLVNDVRLHMVVRISGVSALLVGLAWLTVASAAIADADSISATLSTLPVVAFQTQYGRWFAVRCVLLAAVLMSPLRRRFGLAGALIASGIALAVQPLLGHAGAAGGGLGTELIASETLHTLAAGAWLGGLLPLFLAVGFLPDAEAAAACRGFTPLGLSAVLLLAGTAVVQVTELVGGLPGLFGTTYGQIALIKLGTFIILLMLAALNRLVLTERVARDTLYMRISISLEMLLGAAVIIAAGFLASLTPGAHEQAVWPFPWRLSFDTLHDPEVSRGPLLALAGLSVGIGLIVAGLIWRRIRWYALAAASLILVFSIPHLDVLFVEAYPTSFFTSPTEFAATAIVHGAKLFEANCTICHGADGRGDGPAAKSLAITPADLTAEHFWAHSDGELYWYVSHGFTEPGGDVSMPGFGQRLSSEAIWDLIDYLRARSSGESLLKTGAWSHPVQVPQFDAACPGGRTLDLDDLRGHVLHVIARVDDEPETLPPITDVTSIFLLDRRRTRPIGSACVASEPETWSAFAIILGQAPNALAGWQVLIDTNGWLRAAWHPGQPGDWNDSRVLIEMAHEIVARPLAINLVSGQVHRH